MPKGARRSKERPVRSLGYGRQSIDASDRAAVEAVLRGDRLTQGPIVAAFERALAAAVGARHAVACCNGTAALHLAYLALDLKPGDAVIVPPITFMATANAARFAGADVVFADVDPETATLEPKAVETALAGPQGRRVKAIAAVDFAGHPADLAALAEIARGRGISLLEDACHALGGAHTDGKPVGSLAHASLATFSFHPVKPITTAEGGAVVTDDAGCARRLRRLADHGIEREDFVQPALARDPEGRANPWYHELRELGFNYRLSDVHAALGLSQLKRLARFRARRAALAETYDRLLAERLGARARPLRRRPGIAHGWHLYVVRIPFAELGLSRARVMARLAEAGIHAQVHYIPLHLQPYYRELYGLGPGAFPNAEHFYAEALSLPLFYDMSESDVERVADALARALEG